jgi:putative spermidine/putrescine transport system substrate-binding protein
VRKSGRVSTSLLGLMAAALIALPHGVATAQDQNGQPPASASDNGTAAPAADGGDGGAAQVPPAIEATPERKAEEPQPAPVATPSSADSRDTVLRIATSGGAYLKSQEMAFFAPFGKRQNTAVEATAFDGSYETLKSRGAEWDLVDLDGATAARACNDKLLEPLDVSTLEAAPGGVAASEDYLPGAVQPCAVASVAWSTVVVYNKELKKEPAKLVDFFELKKFPGKRLLPKGPKFTLELALLADGVAPADVYAQLATPEGQNRAFAKLASIKDHIVWFDKPSDIFELMGQKGSAMGLAFNGRTFMAITSERRPLGVLWDHQIYAFDYWAIPHGAKNVAGAKEFIRFATTPAQLAEQARWLPYGPARKSATRLPIKHSELDMEMKPWLPTTEANMQGALALDPVWWSANEVQLKERFTAWLDGHGGSANTPQ